MPIQLLLDWSKALVAIVCSLLLVISFIMCLAVPIVVDPSSNSSSDGDFHASYSHLLKRNAIESENNRLMPTPSSSSIDTMPFNISSLSHNPFDMDAVKNDTTIAKWLHIKATQTTSQPITVSSKNRHSQTMASINNPLDASNDLILDAFNDVDHHKQQQQSDNFKRLKSLAKTRTNITSNDQFVDMTKSLHEQNATFKAKNLFKTLAKHLEHISDESTSSKLTGIQTITHQSTNITPKATIQSVFLDHLNNFNRTKSPNINSINNNDSLNPNNQNQDIANDDMEILSRTERSVKIALNKRKRLYNESSNAERLERSANYSLSKVTKRIQLLIKGRFLQMLPDGTVNGTQNDQNEFTILQRTTVDVGQIRLIGIATCLYLCMNSCGNLYSSREFTNDCIFNERLEDNYNYYTSTHHSTALRTYYMALNRLGVPRKTHLPSNKPLGKLSTYVKAFTLTVPEQRSDAVIGKRFGFNHVKHGIKHLCESGKQLMELTTKQLVYPECNSNSGTNNSNGTGLNKKQQQQHQPNHHIRHANTNHRRAPASLTDRGSNRKNIVVAVNTTVVTNVNLCNTEQCLKMKNTNNNNNGNRSGGNEYKKNMKKSNAKKRSNKKVQVTTTTKMTITATTTTTTTERVKLYSPTPDHLLNKYVDDLDYSGSIHISSNGHQTGIASDEDYFEDDK